MNGQAIEGRGYGGRYARGGRPLGPEDFAQPYEAPYYGGRGMRGGMRGRGGFGGRGGRGGPGGRPGGRRDEPVFLPIRRPVRRYHRFHQYLQREQERMVLLDIDRPEVEIEVPEWFA